MNAAHSTMQTKKYTQNNANLILAMNNAYQILNTAHLTQDTKHWTLNSEHKTLQTRHYTPKFTLYALHKSVYTRRQYTIHFTKLLSQSLTEMTKYTGETEKK